MTLNTPARLALAAMLAMAASQSITAQSTFGIEGPERPPALEPVLDASGLCLRATLRELGWTSDEVRDGFRRSADSSCGQDAPRLPESHEADKLKAALRHPSSHCAFSQRLAEATRRAVDRLIANQGFRFTALQAGWIGFGPGGARRDGWEATRSFGRGFHPLTTPSKAIEGFYAGTVRAECGVGRQIAQYATFYELFGAADFDAAFTRDEIVIGTFNQLHTTDSVLLGASAGEFVRDGLGRATSQQDREAWSGLPGFIVHVFERSTLDDVNNQAENFVVYRVSEAAADALRRHGGFAHYNRRNRELWQLAGRADLSAQRVFERLLFERDAALRGAMPPAKQRLLEQMDAILSDPFYQGFEIYVHPKGVKPIAYHMARLLDRNPRTPFRVELALHNLHTTIYQRWLTQRLAACDAGG